MIIEEQFTETELNVIFEALNSITIQGKNARVVADLIDKIKNGITTIQTAKKSEQLKKLDGIDEIKKSTQK
jgi:hypothetical protein